MSLPATMRLLQRGWLSSNNIVFLGREQTALVEVRTVSMPGIPQRWMASSPTDDRRARCAAPIAICSAIHAGNHPVLVSGSITAEA